MPSNGFTEGAQGALRAAQEIVQQKGHTQLDVEHILLALLTPRDSLVAQLVTQLRGDPEALARRLDDQLNSIPPDPQRHTGLAQIHISQRAQRVVSGAAEEADKLHDTMIGVEHLFLAIAAEPEGPAAQMLGEVLIDQAAIYRLLAEMRSAVSWSKPAPAAGAMAPGRPQGKLSGGFTDQAQEALRTAQEIVQQKRHSQLDVEHILLALLKLPTGLISRILEQLSADPSILVQRLDEQLNAGPRFYSSYSGLAQVHISMRAQRVVSAAAAEAGLRHDEFIGVQHLLLAITAEHGGTAARLLAELGIDHAGVSRVLPEIAAAALAQRAGRGTPGVAPLPAPPAPAYTALRIRGPARGLSGSVRVPGDKSISHRAVLFGALAQGPTEIRGFLPANDCQATVAVVRALGVTVDSGPDAVVVQGRGPAGLREPEHALFCGGSGTTLRLLAGIVAGLPFYSILDGNAQLRRRPMGRVAEPLRQMGATILGRAGGALAPLSIQGGGLQGIDYATPVASAQIKSAVLLAGLFATGTTTVREPSPSRDHTERMLAAMGVPVETDEPGVVRITQAALQPIAITVPGDISSAAFLLAAGAIVREAQVRLEGVGVNGTRTGILDVLRTMGAGIHEEAARLEHGEPIADLIVEQRHLRATHIAGPLIPRLIDELPVLAVVASQAEGITEVRDAAELRVKETDRIATVAAELGKMGARIEPLPDGFRVHGPTPLRGARVDSHGDHRLAMALAVAALVATGETIITDTACIDDSYPGFAADLAALGGDVEVGNPPPPETTGRDVAPAGADDAR